LIAEAALERRRGLDDTDYALQTLFSKK